MFILLCSFQFDKLIEECTESIEETELVENQNKHENKCSSCTVCIVLFWISFIFFVINTGIGIYFTYFYWYLKKDIPRVKSNTRTQATIY